MREARLAVDLGSGRAVLMPLACWHAQPAWLQRRRACRGLATPATAPLLCPAHRPAMHPTSTAERFSRSGINLVLNSRVKAVRDGAVTVVDKENNVSFHGTRLCICK